MDLEKSAKDAFNNLKLILSGTPTLKTIDYKSNVTLQSDIIVAKRVTNVPCIQHIYPRAK